MVMTGQQADADADDESAQCRDNAESEGVD
jgi:hypothetical protein